MGTAGGQIAFKDFIPDFEQKRVAVVFSETRWDSFESAVEKANRWIDEAQVEVLNVETVVLPNLWDADAEGTSDAELRASGKYSSEWYQFLRVWYRPEA